jgi:hypothetical protein
MFASKAGAYPSEAPFRSSWTYSQTLDLAAKAPLGHLSLLRTLLDYISKKFYNILLRSIEEWNPNITPL